MVKILCCGFKYFKKREQTDAKTVNHNNLLLVLHILRIFMVFRQPQDWLIS